MTPCNNLEAKVIGYSSGEGDRLQTARVHSKGSLDTVRDAASIRIAVQVDARWLVVSVANPAGCSIIGSAHSSVV